MRRVATTLVVALLALASVAQARAEEPKPVLVVSIASYDKLVAALGSAAKLAGVPIPVDQMIEGQIMQATGGKGIVGLDKTKPWGVAILSNSKPDEPLVFIPVADLKAMVAALPPMIKHKDGADGMIELEAGPKPVFLKGAGGWVFASASSDQLKDLPADPAKLLGDLPQHFAIAVRVMPQNATPQLKEQILQPLDFLQLTGGDAGAKSVEKLKAFIDQASEVTLGLGVDGAAGKISLDTTVIALPGTELAKIMPRLQDRVTDFPGLRSPEAAISFSTRIEGQLTPAELEDLKAKHDEALKRGLQGIDDQESLQEAAKPVAKEVLSTVLNVWFDTAKGGKQDGGLEIFLAPKPVAVAGAYVTDGEAIGVALKKLAGVVEGDASLPPVKWDAETYKDHKVHVMQVPIADPQAARVLGDKVDIVLAIGKQSVWLAAGADSLAKLKAAMDTPAAAAGPAISGVVRAKPILETASAFAPPPVAPQIKALAGQLAALKAGADELTVKSTPIENGVTVRLDINEGFIKALAMAAMMGKSMSGPPGGPADGGGFGPGGAGGGGPGGAGPGEPGAAPPGAGGPDGAPPPRKSGG